MDFAEFINAVLPEPHTVTVEPYEGSGGLGDIYGAAVEVTPCYTEQVVRRVRVSTQDAAGEEQLSSTTVFAPLGTVAPNKSKVTLPDGRVARVLTTETLLAAGHDLPEHVELYLE